MEDLLFNICFWGVFVGGGCVFAAFCLIMSVKEYRKIQRKHPRTEENLPEDQFITRNVFVTVTDVQCSVKMEGIKIPKTRKVFSVTFRTEQGEILKLDVPEEMYDGFDRGQTGVLALVDGELYGFQLDESVTQ